MCVLFYLQRTGHGCKITHIGIAFLCVPCKACNCKARAKPHFIYVLRAQAMDYAKEAAPVLSRVLSMQPGEEVCVC
jgi:hypothetical protein